MKKIFNILSGTKPLIVKDQIYECNYVVNSPTVYLKVTGVMDRIYCVWVDPPDFKPTVEKPLSFLPEQFSLYIETGQHKLLKQ